MEKAVSICVAIYNIEEKILRECIESLIYDKSEDVEIILGDDCSTNNSGEICKEYAKTDSRIKYIRAEKNSGLSEIRNLMMRHLNGKYVTFVDGDDAVSKHYVQRLLDAARFDYDIVLFDRVPFFGNLPEEPKLNNSLLNVPLKLCRKFSECCLSGAPYNNGESQITPNAPSAANTKAYRYEFLIANGLIFVPGLPKSEDTVFNTCAFFYCKKLGYLNDKIYFYRTNPASICNRYSGNFESIVAEPFAEDEKNLKVLFDGDERIKRDLYTYKVLFNIIENCRLNLFHKNNPHTKEKRKQAFLDFVSREPYQTFLNTFDIKAYPWHERRIVLKLAKEKRFKTLDFMYKHPVSFKIYGAVCHRLRG